ncbi:MAG: Crp/Fnr family transcriptional regulator [Oligoflexia bacterium]
MSTSIPSRTIRPGQTLFAEGDKPESIFLINKGTVVIRKLKGTSFVEIARLHENEIFGELSFFDRQNRSASAYALTEVEVTEIPFEVLEKLFTSIPPYLKTMISSIAGRLRKADEMIKRLQKAQGTEAEEEIAAPPAQDLDAATALAAAASALDDPTSGAPSSGEDPGSKTS